VDGEKFCPKYHRGIPATNGNDLQKQTYIDACNKVRSIAATLSFEQLDEHIQKLEAEFEELKATLKRDILQYRAVRSERIEKMTEDERRELRKIKIQHEVHSKKQAEPKPKTIEGKLAKVLKTSESTAKDMLSMDFDSLMEKYKKAKDQDKQDGIQNT